MPNKNNHLINSLSPYLQQHADNPVDWYPWGEEALQKASLENKPILLSIGYSACHWCHVMAHESFEDEETAAVMNRYFINIKVDREERPDLDKIYQTAHHLLNQRGGGWPLTVFLSPDDQTPFYSGTYFPKFSKYQLPAFTEVLSKIVEIFHTQRNDINLQNQQLREALANYGTTTHTGKIQLTEKPIALSIHALEKEFDPIHGGFHDAPKFPLPTNLQHLLRRTGDAPQDESAIQMLLLTLNNMARGGIYDQLGGGFFRYSIDAEWNIPHFEKMLYDNGPLLAIYAEAAILLHQQQYREIAIQTGNWVLRMMAAPNGGYYSTLDADSLAVEGKYYYWDREQVEKVLATDEFEIFAKVFGLNGSPNFEGHYHLRQLFPISQLSETEKARIDLAKAKLFEARHQRVRPGRDEKILASWNALMIRGMSIAGLLLEQSNFIDSAYSTFNFIYNQLWQDQTLFACYKNNTAYQPAFLDDYAFLLDAALYLLQAKWDKNIFEFAIRLADQLLDQFQDDNGGFYFTRKKHEKLISRHMTFLDETLPSGNGVAAVALNRLGVITSNPRYLNASENTLQAAWGHINHYPDAHHSLIHALEEYLQPPEIIIMRGDASTISTWQMRLLKENYQPHRLIFCINKDESGLPDAFKSYKMIENKNTIYVCKGRECLEPVFDIATLVTAKTP